MLRPVRVNVRVDPVLRANGVGAWCSIERGDDFDMSVNPKAGADTGRLATTVLYEYTGTIR